MGIDLQFAFFFKKIIIVIFKSRIPTQYQRRWQSITKTIAKLMTIDDTGIGMDNLGLENHRFRLETLAMDLNLRPWPWSRRWDHMGFGLETWVTATRLFDGLRSDTHVSTTRPFDGLRLPKSRPWSWPARPWALFGAQPRAWLAAMAVASLL